MPHRFGVMYRFRFIVVPFPYEDLKAAVREIDPGAIEAVLGHGVSSDGPRGGRRSGGAWSGTRSRGSVPISTYLYNGRRSRLYPFGIKSFLGFLVSPPALPARLLVCSRTWQIRRRSPPSPMSVLGLIGGGQDRPHLPPSALRYAEIARLPAIGPIRAERSEPPPCEGRRLRTLLGPSCSRPVRSGALRLLSIADHFSPPRPAPAAPDRRRGRKYRGTTARRDSRSGWASRRCRRMRGLGARRAAVATRTGGASQYRPPQACPRLVAALRSRPGHGASARAHGRRAARRARTTRAPRGGLSTASSTS